MKKIILSFAVILGLTFPLTAFSHDHKNNDHSDSSYDVEFLDTMIEHHRQGIEMFKVAEEKAQSKKVKIKLI